MTTVGVPAGDGLQSWTTWTGGQPELQDWVKDLRSRFLGVSPALARWCGVRPEDMTGRTEARFFSPGRVRQFRLDDLRVLESQSTVGR
jgi:hypothetical protein